MSIGKSDIQTAMWIRDAVKHDNIPALKEMTRKPYEYFPYRYGHALWVYLTSNWGDAIIKPLLLTTSKQGYKKAIDSLLGISADSLSVLWKQNLNESYKPYLKSKEDPVGTKVLRMDQLGKMNIAPSISPNGRYMIFLSDKNVISTDFYLAYIKQKRIVRKLTRVIRDSHIDDYSYLESSGTWSPDNKRFALPLFNNSDYLLSLMYSFLHMPAVSFFN